MAAIKNTTSNVDKELELAFDKEVFFLDGSKDTITSEGNSAAWRCKCGTLLIGRCYYAFGYNNYTYCDNCNRYYRVLRDADKRTEKVIEITEQDTL